MKTTLWKLSVVASAFILAGCSGSSGTDTVNTTTNGISKISGTVPGTLIEAFCEDGSYYKVKSTDNNTTEHPFEIELPSTLSCSLVMTTNEDDNATRVITQIGMVTSDSNGTLFRASENINFGYIPLAMDPSDINDTDGDHVSDDILSIQVDGTSIVIELDNPLDHDNDGLVNVYEDDDGDGLSNYYDDDDDNDGTDDIDEIDDDNDLDGDGISNDIDVDDDNDGSNDDVDSDDDNDGVDDYLDSDDDNDGIDDDNDSDYSSNTTTNILLPTNYTADTGRLLGSQCAQCHGTNGISSNEWDSIAGEDEFATEDFSDEPIMSAQAHGYTDEEKILIDNWLRTLQSND